MTTADKHWLWSAGRSLWTRPVFCLLLLLMLGGPMASLPSAEYLFPGTHSEEQEGTDADETTTIAGVPVGLPHFSPRRSAFASAPHETSLALPKVGPTPDYRLPVSALPAGAFAKRNGVGTPMRC
jgi:hypothetical protein